MSPERHPLDLNYLPEECGRDVKQVPEESSSSGNRRKKSDPKNGNDIGKAYECRFCSLKFCKSQALGGHMNRHRQERETETLNQARQLVYSNENLATQGVPRLGYRDLQSASMNSSLPFGSFYTTKLFPVYSSSILPPSFPEPNLYISSSCFAPFPNQYPTSTPSTPLHPLNVLPSKNHGNPNQNLIRTAELLSYTCTGASLGSGFPSDDRVKSVRQTMDLSASALGEGAVNWCHSNGGRGAQEQILDPSTINLFQDDKFKM